MAKSKRDIIIRLKDKTCACGEQAKHTTGECGPCYKDRVKAEREEERLHSAIRDELVLAGIM